MIKARHYREDLHSWLGVHWFPIDKIFATHIDEVGWDTTGRHLFLLFRQILKTVFILGLGR